MRFGIDVGSELELKLSQAVLLYRNDDADRLRTTVPGVVQTDGNGVPTLGAGRFPFHTSARRFRRRSV